MNETQKNLSQVTTAPKLTIKQENFITAYIETGNASKAYRTAYNADKMKDTTVNSRAYDLLKNSEITARIDQLKDELAKKALWSIEEAIQALKGVLNNPDKATDIIGAVRELNAMHGFNAPQKIEHSATQLIVSRTLDDFYTD
jgi:phage terminase small subunit